MSQPEPPPKRHYNAAGTAALTVIGLLILVPSGLCTGFLGGGALLDAVLHPQNAGDSVSTILMALIVGGPFVVGGGALLWNAVRRMRGR